VISPSDANSVIDAITFDWADGNVRKNEFRVISVFDELPKTVKQTAQDKNT